MGKIMSKEVTQALEAVYTSLHADNEGLDGRIAELKAALTAAGQKSILVEPTKLPQNNRQGRKMMQTYFKKRGVVVEFPKSA
jgi:hypothetical protein